MTGESGSKIVRSVCILPCSANKRQSETWAENLYASESFFLSRRYAQANFDAWLVFSAKYGILLPGDLVAPYDQHIDALSSDERLTLVDELKKQLTNVDPTGETGFTSLCVTEYDRVLEMAQIRPKKSQISTLQTDEKLTYLRKITDPLESETDLEEAYRIIKRLVDSRGLTRFSDAINQEMPTAGIYLFFDKREPRLRDINSLRIVRVGTHGVASGSKATLRDRMRTHFGKTSGGGNHRSSIFRLHVGRSMIIQGSSKEVKSWGEADFPKNEQARRNEEYLESRVSEYIGDLFVAMLDIPGDSSKDNDRAYLEQNLIAILSNVYKPLDPPSHQWLGHHSEKTEIRKSGIWNVNHTAQTYDRRFLVMLEYYVSRTLGAPAGTKPVAPKDWLASVRRDTRQLTLFSE